MNIIKDFSGLVALVILAIMGISGLFGGQKALFGSTACSGITCLSGGLRLVSDAGGDFESDVAAVFASTVNVTGLFTAANVTVTTTNAATSTTKVGCIQTVATSTATPIKLVSVKYQQLPRLALR